jgi:CRISPR-associated protein Csm4
MSLLRYRLRPLSPWGTPWQADTLAGLLCCVQARRDGREQMYDEIQGPASRGEPPFVLSDALPCDLLPVPLSIRLLPWPPEHLKVVRSSRFVTLDCFENAKRGKAPTLDDLQGAPFLHHDRWRNTLSRVSNTTSNGGELFASTETSFRSRSITGDYLSVYARVVNGWEENLAELFRELSETGFGADARVGRGQFDFLGFEDASRLDASETISSGGCVSLSTFQPGPNDPTTGCWESFVKYGRLAPDFGVDDVFKRPALMLRAGATFLATQLTQRLGRMISMKELLGEGIAEKLMLRGYQINQFAYGLAIPFAAPTFPSSAVQETSS